MKNRPEMKKTRFLADNDERPGQQAQVRR